MATTLPTFSAAPVLQPVYTTTAPVTTTAPITTSPPPVTMTALVTTYRTMPPITYTGTATSTPPISYASPRLSVPNLTTSLPRSSQSLPGQHGALPPIEFKFVKDDDFDLRSAASPSRSPYGSTAGFPPPTSHMQEANRLDAEIAAHDQKVRELASQPLTVQNLETQIQELLDGQESLRYELTQVKMQVEQNAHDLEGLRRQIPVDSVGGWNSMPMVPPMPQAPPVVQPLPRASAPQQLPPSLSQQVAQGVPSREAASPQSAVRSQRPSAPVGRFEKPVHQNLGYCEDVLDMSGSQEYFSKASAKAKDSAFSLHQTMQGYISGFSSRK